MQTYYFYQHQTEHYIYVTKTKIQDQAPEFIWVDCFGIGKNTDQLQLINYQKINYEINKNNSISDFIN